MATVDGLAVAKSCGERASTARGRVGVGLEPPEEECGAVAPGWFFVSLVRFSNSAANARNDGDMRCMGTGVVTRELSEIE